MFELIDQGITIVWCFIGHSLNTSQKIFEFEIKCLHLCFLGGIVCISSIKNISKR